MEEFGRHLRRLREDQDLSRSGLRDLVVERFGAKKAVSTDQLANWESGGTAGMSASKLACIVEVLGADYEDVFKRLVTENREPITSGRTSRHRRI
jgi:transcriptional regulator with XRE-family HTH domain